jgi:hypothetical protein
MNHAEVSFIAHAPSREEIDSAISLLRSYRYTVVPPAAEPGRGSADAPPALAIDWRTLSFGAERIQLSPVQARIVQLLIDSSPGWCSRNALRRALWGSNVPSSDPLPVHMCYVREKLRSLTGRNDVLSSSREKGFRLARDLVIPFARPPIR